ncbi:hypothetical protein UNDKW_1659 [Undibacterium sp. KW1]|uniref:hypothetical protein n=1 Tax=Undibacterium sp. KW1 TaxID=2058624 RepID=UPI001331EA11|nr:hypothetical protein [Undibacterium sp. KW1]BBB59932.1 hypothetical protein UNDKW_1659 [Undibacterium sp. KW1]
MSHGIAVKTLDRAGGSHRTGVQDFFAVDGALVVVPGDSITPHGSVAEADHTGTLAKALNAISLQTNSVTIVVRVDADEDEAIQTATWLAPLHQADNIRA